MNNLNTKYPGKVEAPDANYPTGGFKNETTPGVFDGTPFEKGWADDLNAFMQGLIKAAGIAVSSSTDTVLSSQILQGLLYQLLTGNLFVDSGAADVYVLEPLPNNYAPAAYKEGSKYRWEPDNTNTGASTVDVSSLGAKDIVQQGVALTGGELIAGKVAEIIWDNSNDRFELVPVVVDLKSTQTISGVKTFSGGIQTDNVVLKTKVLEIGDWDMNVSADGAPVVGVIHGIANYKKIRGVTAIIRDDNDTNYYSILLQNDSTSDTAGGIGTINNVSVALRMNINEIFDSTSFDTDTAYNRGWVTITYEN